jgi:hypothetical protein
LLFFTKGGMIKSVKYSVKKLLFDRIFSRGRKYIHKEVQNPDYQKTFTECRKIRIVYYLQNNSKKDEGCVILAHPYLSAAKQFYLEQTYFDMYHNLGFHVLTFDFNGFGETKFIDFNFHHDIEEVADWVKSNLGSNYIIGHGISFGAAQMIRMAQNHSNVFSKIIIENCLDKSIHYFKVRNKKIYFFLTLIYFLNKAQKQKNDYTKLISTITNIDKVGFIYCKQDTLTTVEMGELLIKNCVVPFEKVICEGGHLKAINDHKVYVKFIESFTKKEG